MTSRALAALTAHREGNTWEQAAQIAGYSDRVAAYRAAMTLLQRTVAATAAELRAEANARHESKIRMLEEAMYDLDRPLTERVRAAEAHTRAEARHARLNGLDAPVQVAISAVVKSDVDNALAELGELFQEAVPGEVTQVTEGWDQ